MEADQHLQKHVQMLLGRLFDLIFTVDVAIDVFAPHASASGLSHPFIEHSSTSQLISIWFTCSCGWESKLER
jgi:hypothetical protein